MSVLIYRQVRVRAVFRVRQCDTAQGALFLYTVARGAAGVNAGAAGGRRLAECGDWPRHR